MEEFIKEAQIAYDAGNPIITDDEFDLLTDSSSQFDKNDSEVYTVQHIHKMGTLPKVHTYEEVVPRIKENVQVVSQPKFDGVSCEIILDCGRFVSASTRGNGDYGKDIFHVLKNTLIPYVDWNKDLKVIYCELVLESDEPSQADRNTVAGLINSSDPSVESCKNIKLVVYEAHTEISMIPYTYLNNYLFCGSSKVEGSQCIVFEQIELQKSFIDYISETFDKEYSNIKRDGIVFKNTGDSFALKPKPQGIETVLKDVEWSRGKSKFNAVAILEPCSIGGVTISRATLPLSYIDSMNIKIGDVIQIVRSGDVIPKIVGVSKHIGTEEIKEPEECHCGSDLKKIKHKIYCTSQKCFIKEYLHNLTEIIFWGIKRAPKKKVHSLIDDGTITEANIFTPGYYKDKLTEREYNLLCEGIDNMSDERDAKLRFAYNIDGLTFEKLKSGSQLKDTLSIALQECENMFKLQ